jgi:hypothetical protein
MFDADERYIFDVDQVVELTPRASAEVASAAYKHAHAKAKVLRTKRDLKQAEARTYLMLREESAGSKITEATLSAMVTTHPDVVLAEELYIESECEYQLIKAELDSLSDRAMGMKVLTSYVKTQIEAGL